MDKGLSDGLDMSNEQVKKFVLLNVKRVVTNLFKSQLEISSDLNQMYLSKLMNNKPNIPPVVYAELAWWDATAMGNVRKKTLDKGNDALREIEALFESVDVNLKN